MHWPDFETNLARIGRAGLNLIAAEDDLKPEECQVFTNLKAKLHGPVEPRPGYTVLGAGAGAIDVHSIIRVDDPTKDDWSRYFGAGTMIWAGRDAGTGFTDLTGMFGGALSGKPLTLVPWRGYLNGEPWVILVDPVAGVWKFRKVAAAVWEASPLGLEEPGAALATEISDLLTTGICSFDAGDNTQAANWTGTAGTDLAEDPVNHGGSVTFVDEAGLQGNTVTVTLDPGSSSERYWSMMGCPAVRDLSVLQGGLFPANDDDYIHLWIRASNPELLEEIRIYFVCSNFDPAVLPGTSDAANTDAFYKTIRPHDFQGFVEVTEDALAAGQRARATTDLGEFIDRGGNVPRPPRVQDPETINTIPGGETGEFRQRFDADSVSTAGTQQLRIGRGQWSQFGVRGRPLRRREFTRIGTNESVGWANITGIVIAMVVAKPEEVSLSFDDWYETGGFNPDTGEASAIPYDYRYTHYDTRTGNESNPSPVQEEADRLEPFRQRVSLNPIGYGNGAIRQRFYRRGGFLVNHWYFLGENDSDGGQFVDTFGDVQIQGAGTVELDNYRPVQSVDLSGNGVRSNLSTVIGPVDAHVLGLGDNFQPGHIFWSKAENPDAWPIENKWEVCAPSEELLNGVPWGNGALVFSRYRVFAVVSDGQDGFVSSNTECQPGLAARMGLCVTPYGVAYVATDGIRITSGGPSKLVSTNIDPMFHGKTVNGYLPINLSAEDFIQLKSAGTELWFFFADSGGTRRTWVYDFLDEQWRVYDYAQRMASMGYDPTDKVVILGAAGLMAGFIEGGTTDNGVPITCSLRTGFWDMGQPRNDKKLGDVVLDADVPTGTSLLVTTRLNTGLVANPQLTKVGVSGRRRYTLDPFGTIPQRARTIAFDLDWTASATVKVWFLGVSVILEPDVTFLRSTNWEQLGPDAAMGYLTGATITIDTDNTDKSFAVEYTFEKGSQSGLEDPQTASVIVIKANAARRRMHFSWPAVRADQVRLRPLDACLPHMLFKVEWHVMPEPAYISKWDTNHESHRDQYHTGLDIVCDTYNVEKLVQIYVDQVLQTNPATGGTTFPVTANGKKLIHLTFGPGRGHIYRFISLDNVQGHLYSWHWHLDPEPSEQNNWNQNFTPGGHLSDKWIKGVILECDTYGVSKSIQIQVDNVVRETITVNQNERGSVHIAFLDQYLGRMLRLLPVDHNPGRIYQPPQWLFDLEPWKLNRWNTQELDFGIKQWFMPLSAFVTLRAANDVTLQVIGYNQAGTIILSTNYTVAATGSTKTKRFIPFAAMKCAMVKFVATSASAFHLHREESFVRIMPWGSTSAQTHPLGNDDLDPARSMGNATIAAATPGGA